MNDEIKQMFENFTVAQKLIPVAYLRYRGDETTYIVWTIIFEEPSLIADDIDVYSTVTVDVDIFSDGNYKQIENAILNLFKNHEWIWKESSSEMLEEETGLYHKTITFEKERMI